MKIVGVFLLVAILGLGGTYYYKLHASAKPVPHFRTATVERGDLLSTISATGTLEPEEVVNVGAQVAGRIWDFGVDHDAEAANRGKDTPEPAPRAASAESPPAVPPPTPRPSVAEPTAAEAAPPGPAERQVKRGRQTRSMNLAAADKRPRIDYGSRVHVGTELAYIARIDYGSTVHVGTELAYIDDTRYRAQAEQAQAALNRALADLGQLEAKAAQAAAELRRAEQLREIEQQRNPLTEVPIVAISGSDYDLAVANDKVAKANLAVGKAVVEQNRASLEQAQTDLDFTIIESPVEGVIIDRRVNIGQTVVAALNAPSLFLIAKDLSRMQVWASVNEADIGKIRRGMKVRFTVDAYPGETFEGQVKQIRLNAQMTQNVVLYTVVVETANPDGRLLPYLTANLEFEIEQHRGVLLVPNSALRWAPQPDQIAPDAGEVASAGDAKGSDGGEGRGQVWVAAGGWVRPIKVAIGTSDGVLTEISGPEVKEGLSVVIGEELDPQAVAEETTNPFGPPKIPRSKPSPK
ncbi:MAG TPA: efflux RND transporter periplasmic adaptor subunit [Candidatus Anammoximicrobium sp.]|nr:efflux RND transporter periplasmic adaptor subunit [Candidatus Anammoximicrobium sp.]